MAGSKMITIYQCPVCHKESESRFWCNHDDTIVYHERTEREKKRVTSNFKVVSWFHSRASAGLIIEGENGEVYYVYMSDIFKYLEGKELGALTLEEIKKGTAYAWTIIPKESEQA